MNAEAAGDMMTYSFINYGIAGNILANIDPKAAGNILDWMSHSFINPNAAGKIIANMFEVGYKAAGKGVSSMDYKAVDNIIANLSKENLKQQARLHLFNITITEFVSKIIADGFENNFRREMAAFKHYDLEY